MPRFCAGQLYSVMMAYIHQTKKFRRALLSWFKKNRRKLPWQNGISHLSKKARVYRVFVSEIMLQQTRVDQALPYYQRWIKNVPSFEALAKAPLQKILKLWEGLGYYARVRHLKKAARIIVRDHGGKIPPDYAKIHALPGVGEYTAAALASFVHHQPYLAVDGNNFRVLSRVLAMPLSFSKQSDRKKLSEAGFKLLDPKRPGEFNRALMRLGASVCLPRNPECEICPVRPFCKAYKSGQVGRFPLPRRKLGRPHFQIAAGIIWKEGKILIAQRKPEGLLGGLWEFPGGKRKPGETLAKTCTREILEETGVAVRVGRLAQKIRHGYSHFSITLSVFHCSYEKGPPRTLGCQRVKWVRPENLVKYPFPKANQKILPLLTAGEASALTKKPPGRQREN
jgi:A/G-specific adenine glycosylase